MTRPSKLADKYASNRVYEGIRPLSKADTYQLMKAILDPPPPSPNLVKAARKYKKLVRPSP